MPERVYQALVKSEGPVPAVPGDGAGGRGRVGVTTIREAAEQLLMSVAEINRAQLRALMGAGALE